MISDKCRGYAAQRAPKSLAADPFSDDIRAGHVILRRNQGGGQLCHHYQDKTGLAFHPRIGSIRGIK
ncbi:MAG: hypothetical protein ACI9LO_002534 [Planctomycetota bacterium]|jgi:hypothetical protein